MRKDPRVHIEPTETFLNKHGEKEIMQNDWRVASVEQSGQKVASAKDHAVRAQAGGYRERPRPETRVITPYGVMPRRDADEWDHQP